MSLTRNPWLMSSRGSPRLRLFCFPHAGGGAASYRAWVGKLPPGVEVCPVLLPGRDSRLQEPAMRDIPALAAAAAEGLRPALDVPFALFGHSMGALLAFEVARALTTHHGLSPSLFYASASRAPHLPHRDKRISHLPDEQFLQELRGMGGTPPELFKHRELWELLLPTLRSDFKACEDYRQPLGVPLACPITALGGSADAFVTQDELRAWQELTRAPFQLRQFPGGHFYLQSSGASVLRLLGQDFEALLAPGCGPL